MSVIQRKMRKMGIGEYNYEEFKKWYSDKYNGKMHDDLGEFLQFFKEAESEMESFLQINDVLKEWRSYNSKLIEDAETVEDYLSEMIGGYIKNLNEFGYIYEVRDLTIGDSSVFHDREGESYSIQTNVYAIAIDSILNDESFIDVKKKSIYNTVKKALDNLIDKEIKNSSVCGKLPLFEQSVKLVYEDLIIRKTSNDIGGHEVIIRLGVKVL